MLECVCTDLTSENIVLPHADMVIANLLIEYIGYKCFQDVIIQTKPTYVSCVIQINTDESFVSSSPYISAFDNLNKIHHQMREYELTDAMRVIDYYLIEKAEYLLPNGKKFIQLDFKR